jgi:hypothetical protein
MAGSGVRLLLRLAALLRRCDCEYGDCSICPLFVTYSYASTLVLFPGFLGPENITPRQSHVNIAAFLSATFAMRLATTARTKVHKSYYISRVSGYAHNASETSPVFTQYHSSLQSAIQRSTKISNMLEFSTFV